MTSLTCCCEGPILDSRNPRETMVCCRDFIVYDEGSRGSVRHFSPVSDHHVAAARIEFIPFGAGCVLVAHKGSTIGRLDHFYLNRRRWFRRVGFWKGVFDGVTVRNESLAAAKSHIISRYS